MLWTWEFWQGLTERAIKTWCQTFAAMLLVTVGSDVIPAVGVGGVPWVACLSGATIAAILSIATSVGNADFTAGRGGD